DWDDLEATRGRRFVSAPQRLDEDLLRVRRRDPTSFRVEYEAQWGSVEGSYLNPEVVQRMFDPFCPRCGKSLANSSTCGRCEESMKTLAPRMTGGFLFRYRAHADPGESQSNFAIAIGHVESVEVAQAALAAHLIIDHMHVWQPEDFAD